MCVCGGRGGHGVGELRCVCMWGGGGAWSGRVEMACVCGEGMKWES